MYLNCYKAKDKELYLCRVIYMEVVCLILGPTLTSCVSTISTLFAYFLGFDIPTSSLKMFFYYSIIIIMFIYGICVHLLMYNILTQITISFILRDRNTILFH